MRTLLAAALLATITFTLSGCPGGCGAYQGAGDQVYARGSDQLILCDNGGFTADVASGTIEGYYTENAPGSTVAVVGTTGSTDEHAFDLTSNADGTATIPQFGADAWQVVSLDKTGLDHADARCQDLATRTWWTATH
jgi:hypothetical protein